jgi:hypothetical protein
VIAFIVPVLIIPATEVIFPELPSNVIAFVEVPV